VRFHWLLPGTLSLFLLSSPTWAATLQSWRFNPSRNQLEFKTDGGVQPKAKLIFNPTRLVIDLPGTTMDRPTVTQPVGGAIRSLRIGQLDDETTRIVVELLPGYTLDPTQVQFRGASPSQWTVQLPMPQRLAFNLPNPTPVYRPPLERSILKKPKQALVVVTPESGLTPTLLSRQNAVDTTPAKFQVATVQATPDGFFIRTIGGGTPDLRVHRSSDRATINIDLMNATLSPGLILPEQPINLYGVRGLQLSQVQTLPPVARLTLQVNQNSPDWQATSSPFGGVVVLPQRGIIAANSENPPTESQANQLSGVARVQAVQLVANGTQLRIRVDQPLTYTSGWDRSTGLYRITLGNARLAEAVKGPILTANSPLLRVLLRQPDPTTALILLQPAAGVQIGPLNQPSVQLLSLQLQRSSTVLEQPNSSPPVEVSQQPSILSIPVPPVPSPQMPSPEQYPASNGRILVVIDPGHGGKDSGAVGIGGLEEKDIILPIGQQVAAILEQHGVQAILTRKSDYFVDLAPRVELTKQIHANLFVSIHANSIDNAPQANGLETYYYESGLRLAQTIHRSILQSIDIKDRGVRHARFYVLRNNTIPAVLVETGFVTGVEDAPRLASPAYQTQMAEAIARGILEYIKQNF